MNPFRSTPNLLTFLRLCMVPFLVLLILNDHYEMAFGVFIVAGITDALDGLLARMLNQETVLGHYLDPVADKLLLSTLFLVLHHQELISRLVTVLVFGRDFGILMVSAILYATIGMRSFPPSIFGKTNTLMQIVAVTSVLLGEFYDPLWVKFARHWSLDATVVFTVLSGFHYAWTVARRIGQMSPSAPSPG
jgi:cardiolipin synthase